MSDVTAADLCEPQLRILAALARARGALTREALANLSDVHESWVSEYAGTADSPERLVRRSKELTRHPKLVAAGLAEHERLESDGGQVPTWSITPAGRALLARRPAAADPAPPPP